MRGNTFGKLFSLTSFGESHGPAIGVVIDGCPPGLEFSARDLQDALDLRAPGKTKGTTARKESDQAVVLSGIFDGKTLGTPIAVVVYNHDMKSDDYANLKDQMRKGHADHTTLLKYGIRDHRGGGRSSGRETIARVIAGYFAGLVLPEIKFLAFVTKMGPFASTINLSPEEIKTYMDSDITPYYFLDTTQNEKIAQYLEELKSDGNSVGGRISVIVEGVPTSLGEPAFDKLKSDLGKALLSIGGVVSFSFGLGEEMALVSGKELTNIENAFGGIEGGISNGKGLRLSLTFKPTSTVGEKAKQGRHDPCIIPRAVPVVLAMIKIVLADHYLRQNAYQINNNFPCK